MGDMLQQADLIGVGSLPIVILTGLSVGALLALNAASTLQRFGGITLIGQLVSIGMVTELGPLITGLMVAGRNASGMASELGSMIVTEQIDAMRALGTDPTKKLITPRIGATAFMLFFLTIIADLLGLIGGYAVAHSDIRPQLAPVLDLGLADPGLPRRLHRPHQARPVRVHHLHRWLLLRHIHPWRNPGSGPFHHPGRRGRVRADPGGGLLRYQVDLRNFRLQVGYR